MRRKHSTHILSQQSFAAGANESLTVARKVGKKDIGFVQPFLSLLIVSKCALLIASGFFGRNDPIVTVVAELAISAVLLGVAVVWIARSSSAMFRSPEWYLSKGFLSHPSFYIAPPCAPDTVNIIRLLSFVGAILGAIVALLAFHFPAAWGGDVKYGVLLAIVAVLALTAAVWQARARVPYGQLLLFMSEDTTANSNAGGSGGDASRATMDVNKPTDAANEDALPNVTKKTGMKATLLSPSLLHSSSQESAVQGVEMESLPATAPGAGASSSAASAAVPSSRSRSVRMAFTPFQISVGAVQGMELVDKIWTLATRH
jgi:hypothetical protein